MTPEEAREILDSERKEREDLCEKEIDEILKKYRCAIEPEVLISSRGVTGSITLKAL